MNEDFRKDEAGTTAVEFALIGAVFFAMVFGIMEAGRALWVYNTVEFAIQSASRYALVNEDATEEEIIGIAEQKLTDMAVSPDSFSATVATVSNGELDFIEIDATYQYQAIVTGFLPVSLRSYDMEMSVSRPLIWSEDE